MHIFKIFKSFCYGFLIGVIPTWFYLNTGFAELLSSLEIIWASLIASLAWWFKILYEKWELDRKSIAKLQRIASLNLNGLSGIKIFLNEWKQSIEKGSFYGSYVEELNIPSDEIIDGLRNLQVLNKIVPWSLRIKRYNTDLNNLWQHYVVSRDEIFKDINLKQNSEKITGLGKILGELEAEVNKDLIEVLEIISVLRVAGKKSDDSFFRKLTVFTVYSLNEKELYDELLLIKEEGSKKKLI
jgi:hypothetical protein